MRTLKISLIASVIATVVSFWASGLGVTHRMCRTIPKWLAFSSRS